IGSSPRPDLAGGLIIEFAAVLSGTVLTIEPLAIIANYRATRRTGFHLVAGICSCRHGTWAYNQAPA
ncbi:MAG TPA: hypothetical protein VH189_10275, partial [Rhizomicrobium sp.]|nr:hypothetical protein [Rhizomicrobium sp.]